MIFQPTLEGYVNLFTTRSRQTPEFMASLPPAETWYDELVREQQHGDRRAVASSCRASSIRW